MPPYLVFERLLRMLRPGGHLIVTTPNLFRLRNVVRMTLGRPLFEHFRLPTEDAPLGHFIAYSNEELEWQLEHAGFEVTLSTVAQLDHGGASLRARIARNALKPLLSLRPKWRDNVVIIGRRPEELG